MNTRENSVVTYKIRAAFSKTKEARFMSHLDLLRLFQRASRRADLPFVVTRGFNPHQKLSITKALKLGVESMSEEIIFYFDRKLDPRFFIDSINAKLPAGVKIESAEGVF